MSKSAVMEDVKKPGELLEGHLREGFRLVKQWENVNTENIPGWGRKERVNFLENIPKDDVQTRITTAVLLENTRRW